MPEIAYTDPHEHYLNLRAGYDLIAHLDFKAPLAEGVSMASGSCMHVNEDGFLEAGIADGAMPLFLLYSTWDTDTGTGPSFTRNNVPVAFQLSQPGGGDNAYIFWNNGANGGMSTAGPVNWDDPDEDPYIEVAESLSTHTTFPAICGMELTSTEYDKTILDWKYNDAITSPVADDTGATDEEKRGGFLTRGTLYTDSVCGIVSRPPITNEHGSDMISFWCDNIPKIPTPE